jgi:hypothetical protein
MSSSRSPRSMTEDVFDRDAAHDLMLLSSHPVTIARYDATVLLNEPCPATAR